MTASPTPHYSLGSTDAEHERLICQASLLAPLTERLFREAAIGPGQRVLDLGSGVGDVAMLVAQLIGPSGEVVGVERDAHSIARARARAAEAGLRNVSFTESDVSQIANTKPFDAAVKERGYESVADLKKNEISRLPDKPAEKKFDYEAEKVFDKPDSAKLKNDKFLNDAGNFLQKNRFGVVAVVAYMDMKGDAQQDRLLTEARAMVVRDYLVKNFRLEDTRIKTIGLGKSDKVAEGGSVEILLYPEGSTTAQRSGTPSQLE